MPENQMNHIDTPISSTLKRPPNLFIVWGNLLVLLMLVVIFSVLNYIPIEQKEKAVFQVTSVYRASLNGGAAFKLGIMVDKIVSSGRLSGKDVLLQWEDFRSASGKALHCHVDSVVSGPYRGTYLSLVAPLRKYPEEDALQVGTVGAITISSKSSTYFSILRDKLWP
jgi:hypothetical protein